MRAAWATDIHFNFVEPDERFRFLQAARSQADVLLVAGDIGESPTVVHYLEEMERDFAGPVYFVLGNHDFYRGSIEETRQRVTRRAVKSELLTYLSANGVVELTPNTALVGHDGWADGRLGDLWKSDVILNDYLLIEELQFYSVSRMALELVPLVRKLHELADEAAAHLRTVLEEAAANYPKVIALTHVPPFREAAWHQGRISDDNWLPHFSSKAAGDALREVMRRHPASRLLVLCGHTHGGGRARILDNLEVHTGEATYAHPAIQEVFDVS